GVVRGSVRVIPQAGILLAWARELGIPVGGAEEVPDGPATAPAATPATATGTVTADLCLRAIAIKGFAPLEGLAEAVLATPDEVRPLAEGLVASNLAATKAGSYTLSEAGRTRVAQLLGDERERWGVEAASAAIAGFIQLDHRMK